MNKNAKIFVAGHRGLVGSAIVRKLNALGYTNIITATRAELELTQATKVYEFFNAHQPDYVFLAAAKVGGIWANDTFPADFICENLSIQLNVIDAAYKAGTQKLLFLGSSCIYPKFAPQPMKEEYLLTGPLEPTNDAYAIAKIAGIKMCEAYRRQHTFNAFSIMPTNLYGPNDNFDLKTSHVLPALIRKFHEAKLANSPTVTIWGSGSPKREFLHVEDLADASVYLMSEKHEVELINVGVGEDISIADLAVLIKEVTGFKGTLSYDNSKPDGTPRKLLDVSRLEKLGWKAKISLRQGITDTYEWYERSLNSTR